MPVKDQTGRFDNPWFEIALETSGLRTLKGVTVRTVDAPCFIATILTAFADRGKNDVFASHDLEDIITVVDGRISLVEEIIEAEAAIRNYISAEIANLLDNENFRDCLSGHLPPDAANQLRLPQVLARLQSIAEIRKPE